MPSKIKYLSTSLDRSFFCGKNQFLKPARDSSFGHCIEFSTERAPYCHIVGIEGSRLKFFLQEPDFLKKKFWESFQITKFFRFFRLSFESSRNSFCFNIASLILVSWCCSVIQASQFSIECCFLFTLTLRKRIYRRENIPKTICKKILDLRLGVQ